MPPVQAQVALIPLTIQPPTPARPGWVGSPAARKTPNGALTLTQDTSLPSEPLILERRDLDILEFDTFRPEDHLLYG
jgi:hypothetical protein